MLPASLLTLSFACILSIGCAGANDNAHNHARAQHYVITGAHSGVRNTGSRPSRRNILDLQTDNTAWSLYIQALAAMQATAENDFLSYFQLAGIHGRPYIPWDNVSQEPRAPLTGYCTHGSILFPTWHRPYLALFEQVLVSQAQRIARTYPQGLSQIYQTAADNLRMPYWDWASSPQMPSFLNDQTVRITAPSGISQNIPNPLLRYKFQKFPFNNEALFPTSQSTAYDWYLGVSPQTVRNLQANNLLASANLKSGTYYALTKATNYDDFSSTARWGPSLEGIHDTIHVNIGGNWGHMSALSYAAFDPVFWLHHANVDRLTALYQAMYPTSYITPSPEYSGSFALVPGPNVDGSTPLAPFSTNPQGNFYTSEIAQSLSTFGYTYPEIQDWNQTPQQLQSSVISKVNSLYASSPVARRDIAAGSQVREWSAAISAKKFGFDGRRYVVRLFLGIVPENPQDWATSNSSIGSFAVLPPPSRVSGPMPDIEAFNEISLLEGLNARGYDGQDVDATVKYLTDYLQWRVQMLDGSVASIEPQTITVIVQDDVVTLGRDASELPTYGDTTIHPEITSGKAGGYSG